VFIFKRRLQPLIAQDFVGPLGLGEKLGEQLLGTVLAPRGVDGQSADDRLGYRNGDLTLSLANLDGAVGLVNDNRLEPFIVESRSLVPRVGGLSGCRSAGLNCEAFGGLR
jgi:hypothetical protein